MTTKSEQNTESAAAPRKPKNQAKPKAAKKSPRKPAAEMSSKPPRTKKAAEPRVTKQAKVIDALCRPEGATIAEIMELTGWQVTNCRVIQPMSGRHAGLDPAGSIPASNRWKSSICRR